MNPTNPPPVQIKPNLESIPLSIRGNDVKLHIVNIDSRFRQRPPATDASAIVQTQQSSSSDFYFLLTPPIKNVLRIRVTSIEFPNNYPFFSAKRHNTTLRIMYQDGTGAAQAKVITIPDGNYTADDMANTLTEIFADTVNGLTWLTVKFDPIAGTFVFAGTLRFGIDTRYESYDRPFDYGLTYYLGFTRQTQTARRPCSGVANCYELESDQCANFSGDSYLFLQVNDYNCIRHNTGDTVINALAKIILREPKNYMVYDDYAGQHAKEVVFPIPENLSRLHVRVVDAYGVPVDLCSANFSFSLEVLEIQNSSLFNSVQGSLASHYF